MRYSIYKVQLSAAACAVSLVILSCRFVFVKNFFQNFLSFFRSSCRTARRLDTVYHTHLHLSRTFFKVNRRIYTLHFKPNSSIFSAVLFKFHRCVHLFVCRSLERSDILTHHFPFVNTYFHVFSNFFEFCFGRPFVLFNRYRHHPFLQKPGETTDAVSPGSMDLGAFPTWFS